MTTLCDYTDGGGAVNRKVLHHLNERFAPSGESDKPALPVYVSVDLDVLDPAFAPGGESLV